MAALVLALALLLAMATHSDATYCLCTSSNEGALQRAIDFACGNGADCAAIQQNGGCYNPNSVRDHCNYAVNSYFQRKGQTQGSCDFSGTAAPSANPPSSVPSGCVYQASPSTGTPSTGTPSTGTPSTGTPSTGTPTTGTPSTGTPTTGTPTTGTPTTGGSTTPPTSTGGGGTTNPGGFTPGTMVPPGGTTGGISTLGPSGFDPTGAGVSLSIGGYSSILVSMSVAYLLSGLVFERV